MIIQTPAEIGRANAADLKVTWQDGHVSVYPARYLRLRCPCAGCLDEMTGELRIVDAEIPQDVKPLAVQLVGRYAITIQWSDGHRTGIYPFELLRNVCPCHDCRSKRPEKAAQEPWSDR
ncbi:MAG: DUF971 domain-containing protein [Candidatus Omnitrophica bacterium]|nr:DUF971 domain-containing protein [Candidatus Omnitrophota bacterium]